MWSLIMFCVPMPPKPATKIAAVSTAGAEAWEAIRRATAAEKKPTTTMTFGAVRWTMKAATTVPTRAPME